MHSICSVLHLHNMKTQIGLDEPDTQVKNSGCCLENNFFYVTLNLIN